MRGAVRAVDSSSYDGASSARSRGRRRPVRDRRRGRTPAPASAAPPQLRARLGRQTCVAAQPRPRMTAAAEDVAELDAGFVEERRQVAGRRTSAARRRSAASGWRSGSGCSRAPGLRLTVHLDRAPGRQEREAILDLAFDSGSRVARSARAASGRSGTPCGGSRRSRGRSALPCRACGAARGPSCWRKTVALSVGRRNSTVSTSGRSRPSLNRSAANRMLTRRARRSCKRLVALGRGVCPLTRRAGMPASLKTPAMYSAWATLTQKPSARIAPTSTTLSRSWLQDDRAPGRRCPCRRCSARPRRTCRATR